MKDKDSKLLGEAYDEVGPITPGNGDDYHPIRHEDAEVQKALIALSSIIDMLMQSKPKLAGQGREAIKVLRQKL
jgi:hypothetical protein